MQCPKCKQGTVRQALVGSSKGISVVCDSPRCFQFFHGTPGSATLVEDTRVTARMHQQFTNPTSRTAAVKDLPVFA